MSELDLALRFHRRKGVVVGLVGIDERNEMAYVASTSFTGWVSEDDIRRLVSSTNRQDIEVIQGLVDAEIESGIPVDCADCYHNMVVRKVDEHCDYCWSDYV